MSAQERVAEVLGAHVQVLGNPNVVALCSCGIGGEVRALSQIGPWFMRHQAQMLADAGLLAESAPVAGGNGALTAEQGLVRPMTHATVDSLTARLVAARAATDGYRAEAERLRELLDEANAKVERMESL